MENLTPDKIDALFQKHFAQTQAPVDESDVLWAAIQEKRKPNRKRFVWWWSLAFGVLLSGILYYAYPSFEFGNKKTDSVTVPIAYKTIETNADFNNKESIKTSSIARSVLSKEKKTEPLLPIIKTSKKDKQLTSKEKGILNNLKKTTPYANIVSIMPQKTNPKSIRETPTTYSAKIALSPLSKRRQFQRPQHLPVLQPPNLVTRFSEPSSLQLGELSDESTKTRWDRCKIREQGTFFVNGYGQASLVANESITERPELINEITNEYSEAWQEKFAPFGSYSGGIQLGYMFPWKGYISGGVAYQYFQTKYESTQRVVEQITVYDEMAYFYIDDNNETIWVADSVTVTNIYDQAEIHRNNHRLWHIPIQLGYIGQFDNFRLGGNIEILFNISKNYKGYFMNPNRSIVEIDTAKDKNYMSTSLGLSLSGGLHLGYMMSEHWEVYVNPRFRFNKESFLDDSQMLKITRNFASLRAGLLYHF